MLGVFLPLEGIEKDFAGTPKSAARAALFGIWASLSVAMTLRDLRASDTVYGGAQRHRHDARHRVSPQRPPARPAGGGHRKLLHPNPADGKNLKNPARPSARQDPNARRLKNRNPCPLTTQSPQDPATTSSPPSA
ncbi:hypothetical protein D3C87_1618720 [compost metagenome]